MPPRKKSGRITLRMDPGAHARVEKTAKKLGTDINGLLNLLIRTELPYWEDLVDTTANEPHTRALFQRWQKLNPGAERSDFWHDTAVLRRHRCFRQFRDGKWYRFNFLGTDFVEALPEERFWEKEERNLLGENHGTETKK